MPMPLIELDEDVDDACIRHIAVHQFQPHASLWRCLCRCLQFAVQDNALRARLRTVLRGIRSHNQNTLAASDGGPIALLLDSRSSRSKSGKTKGGFLGDMVEASRIIPILSNTGRDVKVLTTEAGFIGGNLPNVKVLRIDRDVPMKWHSSCSCGTNGGEFYDYVRRRVGQNCLIAVPTICRIPHWLGESASPPPNLNLTGLGPWVSESKNSCRIAFRKKKVWLPGELAVGCVNQVHAHMLWLYLLGVIDEPMQISPPYLVDDPLPDSIVDVFRKHVDSNERIIIVHVGTADCAGKAWRKGYWRRLVKLVAQERPDLRMCFAWPKKNQPNEDDQQAFTEELISIAKSENNDVLTFRKGLTLQNLMLHFRKVIEYFEDSPILLGVDSLPAGHLFPALGGNAIVIGNRKRDDFYFSCPAAFGPGSLLVLPSDASNGSASSIPVVKVRLAIEKATS